MHIILTLLALFFLGFNFVQPGFLQRLQGEDRTCRLIKGRMDCYSKITEYKINAPLAPYSFLEF